eukprot:2269962-Prymnesium_polylepis.2
MRPLRDALAAPLGARAVASATPRESFIAARPTGPNSMPGSRRTENSRPRSERERPPASMDRIEPWIEVEGGVEKHHVLK